MTREEAYDAVAKIAAEHALILQGFGGVLTIVHPNTQRAEGFEEHCLYMAGMGPMPESKGKPEAAPHKPRTDEQLDIFHDTKEPAA